MLWGRHITSRLFPRTFATSHGAGAHHDELKTLFNKNNVDTVILGMSDIYGRFLGKRLCSDHVIEDKVLDKGSHACDYLFANDMNMDPIPGFAFASFDRGYGDMHLSPDVSSLVLAQWHKPSPSAIFMCDIVDEKTHKLVDIAPRSMLKKQIADANDLGFGVHAASELEYYTFAKSYDEVHKAGFSVQGMPPVSNHVQDYHLLQTHREEGVTGLARRTLRKSGIPVEGTKGEAGIGQEEINVKYADALVTADHHMLVKHCLKEIASDVGQSVTFMSKPFTNFTGSGFHIHLNLYNLSDGKNAFLGNEFAPDNSGGLAASRNFKYFLGGWMKHATELMAFFAPTNNSYKRFKSASWAPTKLSWSVDNRTAGFRVVGVGGKSLRIEFRIPGADANPYLAIAASIAAGLDGIKNEVVPPPCFQGNSYEATTIKAFPKNLKEASVLLRQSEFARRALGENVVEHYAHFYDCEHTAYEQAVTDWERIRYFEQI
eukprot:TRINITY_DN8805_c0_g1_i1.p1 TRINITY_DN8805_c0_g1~~TRINITY_DN8805_c0_g1_i1.p1  ORF type:complete len:488 (-),score=129.15 TRINITY_DN8805_c0_g1_i1:54-1517(-)